MQIYVMGITKLPKLNAVINNLENIIKDIPADIIFNISRTKGVSELVYNWLLKNKYSFNIFNTVNEMLDKINEETNIDNYLILSFKLNNQIETVQTNNIYSIPIKLKSTIYDEKCKK